MTRRPTARVDFHLHSHASNVTDYYAANSLALPESYSEPVVLYDELQRQGMTLVTLTDHNSIDGVKELLDLDRPGVFISAEMTASFPEDGCNIHVTVANVTETQFAEVNRLRRNLYEMVDYLDQQIAGEDERPDGNRIAYFMTHPLMSTQNRPYGREGSLSVAHLERALLLINCFEIRNGTRTRSLNELTLRLLQSLDRKTIERLANEHGIQPKGETPWLKGFVAGSDDHSGINPGRTWTEFPHDPGRLPTANDLVDAIRRRETRAAGDHGGPVTLAHAMVKLVYDGSTRRGSTAGPKSLRMNGVVRAVVRQVLEPRGVSRLRTAAIRAVAWYQRRLLPGRRRRQDQNGRFERIMGRELIALLADARFRRSLHAAERTDDRIFLFVSSLVNRIFASYVARIAGSGSVDLVRTIKEIVAMVSSNVFVSLPYFLSYFHQSSDRMIVRDVRRAFDLAQRERLVLVTDTFFEVNGVARSIRRMIDEARRRGIDLTVVTCLGAEERAMRLADPEIRDLVASGELHILESTVHLDMPHYDGLKIHFPPFLELLKFVQEQGFTKMQISTPGTVGVAGLLAAKLLQIDTSSTYHTSFPEYVENYTQDVSLEALTWKYMILFYHSVDEVVVPSRFIARLLHDRGLRNRKLLVLDRWVDTERFHPGKRVAGYWRRFGVENEEQLVKFVYLGRVSVEKNLSILAEAFRRLCAEQSNAHLMVVGDGPYRQDFAAELAGLPVTFCGFLEGEDLAHAIASADAKLFPSTTDTWGNAPLEALASGLPVVVSDRGGPQELVEDGVHGFCVAGRDVDALLASMERLMDPGTRARMGRAARAFVERNRVDLPFSAILESDAHRERERQRRAAATAATAVAAPREPQAPADRGSLVRAIAGPR